jgi:hypothetical protein
MVMTIDQHNNSLPYIPWLVDKIYTDDEINELFDFTEDEINLIDKTIKKFERHSFWFKRYMCGPSSVTDEDVQKDLNECNLIGSYDLIWSILNKVQKYGDMMKNHCTSNDVENSWYCKYPYLMPSTFTPHGKGAISDREYANDNNFIGKYNLLFSYYYYSLICKDITSYIPFKKGPCGKITEEKVKSCLYGTHDELVNFNYYINENKLPLFINMVMTIDQHNNSLPYIPWLVDKIYTDDEINKLFNFSEDEINLIDKTIKKFERHSLWFKRYMCGPSSVSDEDVQKDLKEKGIC